MHHDYWQLVLFLNKVITVDFSDFIGGGGGDTDTVVNHQASELFTINKNYLDVNFGSVLQGLPGECRCSNKNAFI